MCSGSEVGSYLRCRLLYHSTQGLREIKKKKKTCQSSREDTAADRKGNTLNDFHLKMAGFRICLSLFVANLSTAVRNNFQTRCDAPTHPDHQPITLQPQNLKTQESRKVLMDSFYRDDGVCLQGLVTCCLSHVVWGGAAPAARSRSRMSSGSQPANVRIRT